MTKETAITVMNLLLRIRECDRAIDVASKQQLIAMPAAVEERVVGRNNLYDTVVVPEAAILEIIRYYTKLKSAALADLENL